jgi:hypothetical protein
VNNLVAGDEIILYSSEGDLENPIATVVYMGNIDEDDLLYSATLLSAEEYRAKIVRSGYRNQLKVAAGTISALQNPSEKGPAVNYTKIVSVPK